jgi:hypothetical protein
LQDKGSGLLPELVRRHGLGLVIIGDTVAVPELSALAGVRYVSEFDSPDTLAASGTHFITRGLDGREKAFVPADKYLPGNKTVVQDATVLMKRGPHPFLAVKEWRRQGGLAGTFRSAAQMQNQIVRDLLKRSLVFGLSF